MRGGAVAARWAHNPKVTGSSPVPATINKTSRDGRFLYLRVLSTGLGVSLENLSTDIQPCSIEVTQLIALKGVLTISIGILMISLKRN